jgi:hypothetical protein
MQERHHAGSASRFLLTLLCAWVFATQCFAQKPSTSRIQNSNRGVLLENLSWDEAEHILTQDRVVVIALGAESKEHGRHLQLNNDWVMAEYLKNRVLSAAPVVIAPTINYSFYPLSWSIPDQHPSNRIQHATWSSKSVARLQYMARVVSMS